MSEDKENQPLLVTPSSLLSQHSSPLSTRDLKRAPPTPLTSSSGKRTRIDKLCETLAAGSDATKPPRTPASTKNHIEAEPILPSNPLSLSRLNRLKPGDSRTLWALTMREISTRRTQFSLRNLLRNFISTEYDRFQMISSQDTIVPPFACSFSHRTHAGKLLAVADEEGVVTFIDTLVDNRTPLDESIKMEWIAHDNAIFDVVWSDDDTRVMTASGDQTVRVWDVETHNCLGVLGLTSIAGSESHKGHQASVKTVANHPQNPSVYITSSRDGKIILWDLRIPGSAIPDVGMSHRPVYIINGAHVPEIKTKRRSTARSQNFRSIHSVTAALFLPGGSMRIASAGAADGLVKIWDMRMGSDFTDVSQNSVSRSNQPDGMKRPHGLTSMSMNSNGSLLFTSCSDHSVHVYKPTNLGKPICQLRAANLNITSFYVKTTLSPDDRFLASGSSDGGLYIWDIESCLKKDDMFRKYGPVVLKGHESEVTAVSWSGGDNITEQHIANASDDMTIRIWKWDANVDAFGGTDFVDRPTHLWGRARDAEIYTGLGKDHSSPISFDSPLTPRKAHKHQ